MLDRKGLWRYWDLQLNIERSGILTLNEEIHCIAQEKVRNSLCGTNTCYTNLNYIYVLCQQRLLYSIPSIQFAQAILIATMTSPEKFAR